MTPTAAEIRQFKKLRTRAYAKWKRELYLDKCRAPVGAIRKWHFGPFDPSTNECVVCGDPPDPHTVLV